MVGAPSVGPWRWMIVLSRMGVCFVSFGVFKSMGLFVHEFVEYFQCTTHAAGLAISLPFTVGIVTVISNGLLLKTFELRPLMVLSSAVYATSLMAAGGSQSLYQVALCLTGRSLGLVMMQTISVAVLLEYFPDNFASVNGLSSVGSPLGMMIFPPVVQQLIPLYGWRGALALLGAAAANLCVFAALARPLHVRNAYKPIVGNSETSSTTNPPHNESLWGRWSQKLRTICETIDLQMFVKEPRFVTTQIVNFLCGVILGGWHIYLIPHGVDMGFSETRSSFLATFGGLGTIFGRLSHGFLIDRGLLQAQDFFAGSAFLLAVVCLLNLIASPSYEAVATLTTLAGFCFGVLYPLLFVLSVSFPEERQMSALAWMLVFFFPGMSAGGFLFGWIYDMTGDYGVVFCTMGFLSLVMGALSLTLRSAGFPCKARETNP